MWSPERTPASDIETRIVYREFSFLTRFVAFTALVFFSTGDSFWIGDKIVVEKCILRQKSSEYRALGQVKFPRGHFEEKPEITVKVVIPHAEFDEMVTLFCEAPQPGEHRKEWILDWTVPEMELGEQMVWFEGFAEAREEHESRLEFVGEKVTVPDPVPDLFDVCGTLSGIVEINSKDKLDLRVNLAGEDWRFGPHMIGKCPRSLCHSREA